MNSITYKMRDSFSAFLQDTNQTDTGMPTSTQQLEQDMGIKLVVGDLNDPERVGFRQWRVAFYCTDIISFMHLMDKWFVYKERTRTREKPFQVMIHPHTGIDLNALTNIGVGLRILIKPR